MSEGWRQKLEQPAEKTVNKHSILEDSTVKEQDESYQILFDTTIPIETENVIFKVGETVYDSISSEFSHQLQDGKTTNLSVTHQTTQNNQTIEYTVSFN